MQNILSFNNVRHLEPKKSNLFTMVFDELPNSLGKTGDTSDKSGLQMNLISAGRPDISVKTITMPRLNMKYVVASQADGGMAGTVSVKFRDVIQFDTSRVMYNWFTLIFDRKSGAMGYSAAYKTNGNIILLDPMGQEIENWRYEGIFPTTLKLGELAYGDNANELDVDVTFSYDLAYLVSSDTTKGPKSYTGWKDTNENTTTDAQTDATGDIILPTSGGK